MHPIFVRSLTFVEKQRLKALRQSTSRVPLHKRAQVILLSHEGKTASEIAAIVGYTAHTVTNRINRFNEEGVDGLGDRPHGGSAPTWDDDYLETLLTAAQRTPESYGIEASVWSVPLLNDVVRKKTGFALCNERVRELLHEHGLSTTRAKHALLSPDPQFATKRGR